MKKLILNTAIILYAMGISAQNSDTLGVHLPDADELHILSTETSIPVGAKDDYMRIVLDRNIEADKWTLIVFPTILDGYYFGVDAERYKVTECDLTTSPITLKREKMSDLDDFTANQMYLVKSKSNFDSIVAMSPGMMTSVPKDSGVTLICLTLNEEPTAVQSINATNVNMQQQIYDLGGRISKSVRSGIYIINGKKVFER